MKRLFAVLLALLATGAGAETWRFAAIGDTPYSDYERRELPAMLDAITAEHVDLIVHAGDFKHSRAPCSDALFADRKALFDGVAVPFIYTPGDNEWRDCRLLPAGHHDERERLDRLRALFFAEPFSLGRTRLSVERQSAAWPENLRWRLGPVVFVSLNVPGPDNNFGLNREPRAEFLERNPALLDWLRKGFAVARARKAPGIVVLMQANPGFKLFNEGLGHAGFRDLLGTLIRETLDFSGQVLLIHGDSHHQRIDKPLNHPGSNAPIANLTRLETFGYPFMGWVKVVIDSESPALFRFETRAHGPQPPL